MNPFLALFLASQSVVWNVAPAGTPLHIRLTHAVGSYASRVHSPIEAVLISPVKSGGDTIIPAGRLLSGEVKSVRRVALGFIHETASLNLNFNSVTGAASTVAPIATR